MDSVTTGSIVFFVGDTAVGDMYSVFLSGELLEIENWG